MKHTLKRFRTRALDRVTTRLAWEAVDKRAKRLGTDREYVLLESVLDNLKDLIRKPNRRELAYLRKVGRGQA